MAFKEFDPIVMHGNGIPFRDVLVIYDYPQRGRMGIANNLVAAMGNPKNIRFLLDAEGKKLGIANGDGGVYIHTRKLTQLKAGKLYQFVCKPLLQAMGIKVKGLYYIRAQWSAAEEMVIADYSVLAVNPD